MLKVMGIVLVVAGLAEKVHVSAAVGAFIVGMALSGEVSRQAEETLEPLKNLFAAVFFVNFGLETDPTALPPVLPLAIALAVCTIATKFATGWWAAGHPAPRSPASSAPDSCSSHARVLDRHRRTRRDGGPNPALGSVAAAYVLILAAIGPLAPRLAGPIVAKRRKKNRAKRLAQAAT